MGSDRKRRDDGRSKTRRKGEDDASREGSENSHISRGEIVPEVMTTLLNFSKTGAIARAGSRHLEIAKEKSNSVSEGTRRDETRPADSNSREMEDGVGDGCCVRFVGFEDEEET